MSNEKYFRGSLDISRITNTNKNLDLTYPACSPSAGNSRQTTSRLKCELIKDTPVKFNHKHDLGRTTNVNQILKLTCPICTPSASCSPNSR